MTILAVGGELDCYRVRPPDDQVNTNSFPPTLGGNQYGTPVGGQGFNYDYGGGRIVRFGYMYDPRFSRGAIALGAPGFFLDLAEGSETIWLRMNWSFQPNYGGYFGNILPDDPGFVLRHGEAALVRFKLKVDPVTKFVLLVAETSGNGVTDWVSRIDPLIMRSGNSFPTYQTFDFRVTMGNLIEVYVNGAKISSYTGPMFTAFTTCDNIMFYQTSGLFSEVVVSDVSTLGLRLLTQERALPFTGPFGDSWNEHIGLSVASRNLDPKVIIPANYWQTNIPDAILAFSAKRLASTYEPNPQFGSEIAPFDQTAYSVEAVAVAGAMSHISGAQTVDARFVMTDGLARLAVSPNLGLTPSFTGNVPRIQYVWNESPFTSAAWSISEVPGLGYGVQAI